MSHDVSWAQPPPLWASPGLKYVPDRSGVLEEPTILRFSTDSFMDDFLNLVATEPDRMREFEVKPETWRGFTPAPVVDVPRPTSAVLKRLGLFRRPDRSGTPRAAPSRPGKRSPETPLKLYQPAHQRYYLVASSLVCRVPGLPDRAVSAGRGERIGFVMRRLLPPPGDRNASRDAWEEHAWTETEGDKSWQRIVPTSRDRLAEDEELLPMFGVNVAETGRARRRLYAGMIPAGRREEYLGAPRGSGRSQPGITSRTARKILLRKEVTEPWKALATRAEQFNRGAAAPSAQEELARLKAEREHLQSASWLILLDLARYLKTYLEPVWRAVSDRRFVSELNSAQADVYSALVDTALDDDFRTLVRYRRFEEIERQRLYASSAVPANLRAALARFADSDGGLNEALQHTLENETKPYDRHNRRARRAWPRFLFPLADPLVPLEVSLPEGSSAIDEERPFQVAVGADPALSDRLDRIDRLAALIVRALEDLTDQSEPDVPTAAVAPANALEGWFVIRCVYDRPACEPLHRAVVSERTDPFELAGFFDPDAPARPIRIGLPIDTSPAGLRKFDRNTAFVISDVLCGQIKRLKGLTLGDLVLSVLPWPLHKDLPVADGGPCESGGNSLGMICSLSIPIITICALILLMVMVTLLDIIFRWVPYFIMCFPIPGLGAKSDE